MQFSISKNMIALKDVVVDVVVGVQNQKVLEDAKLYFLDIQKSISHKNKSRRRKR